MHAHSDASTIPVPHCHAPPAHSEGESASLHAPPATPYTHDGAGPEHPATSAATSSDAASRGASVATSGAPASTGDASVATSGAPASAAPASSHWSTPHAHGAVLTQRQPLGGAAQFWIDGRGVAAEFATLDRRLAVQAGLAWFVGAAVIVLVLAWSFRRLTATNDQLQARTDDLQRANRELMLAAKTSALGAVTAHLIHEIKNPVAGLEVFVANQSESGGRADAGAELAAASELTKRLRTMINDVVAVLRDEQHDTRFELTGAEIAEMALGHSRAAAVARSVTITSGEAASTPIDGRRANLAGLVLRNLLQNAIEATAPGGTVRLFSRADPTGGVAFFVEDSGAGDRKSTRLNSSH